MVHDYCHCSPVLSSYILYVLHPHLSFEENAESECERLLQEAATYDPHSPEVHQMIASLRISQNRKPDALQSLNASYNLWINLGIYLGNAVSYWVRKIQC